VKEHYLNYSVVLVRLQRITAAELKDLLNMSFRFESGSDGLFTNFPRRLG